MGAEVGVHDKKERRSLGARVEAFPFYGSTFSVVWGTLAEVAFG